MISPLGRRGRPIVFVDGKGGEVSFVSMLRELDTDLRRRAVVITFDCEGPEAMKDLEVDWRSAQSYLSDVECMEIDRFAYSTARKWFLEAIPDREDITEWNGISLGLAHEWFFAQFLLEAAKYACVLRNVLAKESPDAVLLFTEYQTTMHVFAVICGELGIDFQCPNECSWSNRGHRILDGRRSEGVLKSMLSPKRKMKRGAASLMGRIWSFLLKVVFRGEGYRRLTVLEDWPFHEEAIKRDHAWAGNVFLLFWDANPGVEYWFNESRIGFWFRDGWHPWMRGRLPIPQVGLRRRWYKAAKAHFLRIYEQVAENPGFHRKFCCSGMNLWPVVAGELAHLFSEVFPRQAAEAEIVAYVLREYRVDVTLLSIDYLPAQRTVAMVSGKLGIPTIYAPQGILLHYPGITDLVITDKVAAWGPALEERYSASAAGPNGDRLIVTGNFKLDALPAQLTVDQQTELRKRLGLHPEKTVVTVATQPSAYRFTLSAFHTTDHASILLKYALLATQKRAEIQLAVKIRPGDDEALIRELMERFGPEDGVILTSTPLYDLLRISDIVVVKNSTVGLEAMVLGRPVIVVNSPGVPDFFPYVQEGAALKATNPQELGQCIDAILRDKHTLRKLSENAARFVQHHAGPSDGRSFDRLATLVITTANGKGSSHIG